MGTEGAVRFDPLGRAENLREQSELGVQRDRGRSGGIRLPDRAQRDAAVAHLHGRLTSADTFRPGSL